jgi:hypothetical protein
VKAAKKLCRHRFRFAWSSGSGAGGRKIKLPKLPGQKGRRKIIRSAPLTFGFRCNRCGENVSRKATLGERKFYAPMIDWTRSKQKSPNIHTVWHEFARRFKHKDGFAYRWIGYDLMMRVEKWAAKYPKDVEIASIDDSYFTSSVLVLIEHKTARSYMGTTVVVIPQCSGESPLEFFLYPCDRQGLLKALRKIAAVSKRIEKLQRKDEATQARAIKKNLQHPAVI